MSIRGLALDLYRAQQKIDRLEKELQATPVAAQDDLLEELRHAKAEWQLLRKMLDGKKEVTPLRRKFQ
jgi:hypothetical protein